MFISTSKCDAFCKKYESDSFNFKNKSSVSWCFLDARFCISFKGITHKYYRISNVYQVIEEPSIIFSLAKSLLEKFGIKFKKKYHKNTKKTFGQVKSKVFGFDDNHKNISTKGSDKDVHLRCMWFIDSI